MHRSYLQHTIDLSHAGIRHYNGHHYRDINGAQPIGFRIGMTTLTLLL